MDWEGQKQLDRRHRDDPEVGDYWHEMFAPVCVVLGRRPGAVLICEKCKSTDEHHWTWDLSEVRWLTSAEFAEKLTYKTASLADKTWCSVRPKAHAWAREAAKAEMFGDVDSGVETV